LESHPLKGRTSRYAASSGFEICHPERSVRLLFPPLLLRRAEAQSKDLRFVASGTDFAEVEEQQVHPLRLKPSVGMAK
jgi:hypothetical protein